MREKRAFDRARRVDAFFDELARMQVFAPDTAFEALGGDARDEVHARLDEHRAALGRFFDGPTHDLSSSIEWASTRSRASLRATYARALVRGASFVRWGAQPAAFDAQGTSLDAQTQALLRAAGHTYFALAGDDEVDRSALDRRLREGCRALRARSSVSPDEGLAVEALCGLALAWIVGPCSEWASPWAPLLALWARGAWPVWTLGASWLLYVPLRGRGALGPMDARHEPRAHADITDGDAPDEAALRAMRGYGLVEIGVGPVGREPFAPRGWLVDHPQGNAIALGRRCVLGRLAAEEIHAATARVTVSRRHCAVRLDGTGARFVLEDLASTGGTMVNGLRSGQREALGHGDRLGFGSYALHLLAGEAGDAGEGLSAPGLLCLFERAACPAALRDDAPRDDR